LKLVEGLNTAQREAATTTEGPLLVLAGAGTGKTRVITFRIVHLLDNGVAPGQILAVTFTNKAAREMRERVESLLGNRPKELTLSTFHSLGMKILREHGHVLGYRRNFTIYDTSDQSSLVRTLLRDLRGATKPAEVSSVLGAISRAKSRFILPAELLESAVDAFEDLVARVYERYQEELRTLNCADFDDLILLPVCLLKENEDVRRAYQLRWRYLLVDEYQDTNHSQYELLGQLIGPYRNICVVGDDDQSIYGFRGAESEKILRFEQDFPGAKVVKLEENYRSTGAILKLANEVIRNNTRRHSKSLRSHLPDGAPVRLIVAPDEVAEVSYVLQKIQNGIREHGASPGSFAILMRSAIQARPFEEKLRLREIPYTLVGGQSYYDRKEIRDVLAYWRTAINPADDYSFLRIINFPRRGFGTKFVQKLDAVAREGGISLLQALGRVGEGAGTFADGVRGTARGLALTFATAHEGFQERRFSTTARDLVGAAQYGEALKDLYQDPLTLKARWNAVEELFNSVDRWSATQARKNGDDSFADYLRAFTMDPRDDRKEKDKNKEGVLLMTLHAAKGLEFPTVFLVGLEDDLLPHHKAAAEGERSIEEERRLFYVGITRARKTLCLSYTASRRRYGRPCACTPTRFLTELEDASAYTTETFDPDVAASPDEVSSLLAAFRSNSGSGPAKS